MSQSILSRAPARSVLNATLGVLAVLVITSVHHVYGAAIFDTPWRLHIVFISIPVAIIILGAIPIARSRPNSLAAQIASWVYIVLAGGFAVIMIGFYEGGYNHLIPNIQYTWGVDHPLREGLYVPPDDLIFQLTGIAQFGAALVAGWWLREIAFPRQSRLDRVTPGIRG